MRFLKRNKSKILVALVFLIILNVFILSARKDDCRRYVHDFAYDCRGVKDLKNYIDNSSISLPLRLYISEDDLDVSTDEEIMELCKKVEKIKTGHSSIWGYSTEELRWNDLGDCVKIDGVEYIIHLDFTFAPRVFSSTPKLIDWKVNILER